MLRTQLEQRESLIERARAEAAHGAEEVADLHAAMARLRDAIAIRARDAAMARRRFSRSPEALDRSRDELRRDADRIAALERQAEALRDAIHSQLPYSLHASPLQEALPLGEETEVQSEA
jgi:DNA repair exonuclease SbcCD ATPase subunit